MNLRELSDNLGLNEEEYSELLAIFVDAGRADLQKLDRAIDQGDASTAAKAAHSLKGAAANLGLADFSDAAKKAEGEAREALFKNLSASAQVLKRQLDQIVAEAAK